MEENHVSFPWGMAIIREGRGRCTAASFLSLSTAQLQNTERREDAEEGYQRADRRPFVRALHVLRTIGDETLYLIDSPQTCVTTTSYCL